MSRGAVQSASGSAPTPQKGSVQGCDLRVVPANVGTAFRYTRHPSPQWLHIRLLFDCSISTRVKPLRLTSRVCMLRCVLQHCIDEPSFDCRAVECDTQHRACDRTCTPINPLHQVRTASGGRCRQHKRFNVTRTDPCAPSPSPIPSPIASPTPSSTSCKPDGDSDVLRRIRRQLMKHESDAPGPAMV